MKNASLAILVTPEEIVKWVKFISVFSSSGFLPLNTYKSHATLSGL